MYFESTLITFRKLVEDCFQLTTLAAMKHGTSAAFIWVRSRKYSLHALADDLKRRQIRKLTDATHVILAIVRMGHEREVR